MPLKGFDGNIYELPLLFTLGFWNALIIGILFLGSYARRVSVEAHSMNQALLATQMALDREQKLTDLGGVVAAAGGGSMACVGWDRARSVRAVEAGVGGFAMAAAASVEIHRTHLLGHC